MQWLKCQSFGTHVMLSVVAGFVIGVSAEVFAGTVYTWTTDDGTVSYTDDEKRVPARYKDRAEVQVMEGLDRYHRFTPVEAGATSVAEARGAGATPSVSAGPPGLEADAGTASQRGGISVITGGTRYGRGGVILPVDAAPGDEPVVIESRRVKRDDSMATSHETVVRQGDRVISVRRNEPSHRDGTSSVPPLD